MITIDKNYEEVKVIEGKLSVKEWIPQPQIRVKSVESNNEYILESVNQQTQFVILLDNQNEREVLSFEELQSKYIPLNYPS